jgi:ribosomal protein L35AE/L33A
MGIMSSYREFHKGERAAYYSVSKKKIHGHHILTPYRSMPSEQKGQIIIGGKVQYKLNRDGYATSTKLPTTSILKTKRPQRQAYNPLAGWGF